MVAKQVSMKKNTWKSNSIHNLTIVVRSVFQEDNKYYPQVFLDECLYEL